MRWWCPTIPSRRLPKISRRRRSCWISSLCSSLTEGSGRPWAALGPSECTSILSTTAWLNFTSSHMLDHVSSFVRYVCVRYILNYEGTRNCISL
ncbi:UDP-glucose pyrophosphorylase2 [Zea mays]|uniref:UDP-glucose pyrophosphorylase2 n=1 Tax=Zea mays TaxID=4577 RepID=A0A1D6IAU3_MAIZE|nr:UDP-glucose pyrophosphorylase2 [Zea mays]